MGGEAEARLWSVASLSSVPGELLAAFEMFELVAVGGGGGGGGGGRLPDLPNVKEESVGRADTGPVLPLPPAIRPKLVKYRSELHRPC